MDERIEKLKRGEVVQRLITYQGQRVVEHFQPNKDHADRYDRYMMPPNRDKTQSIMHNYALNIIEIERLLNTKSE